MSTSVEPARLMEILEEAVAGLDQCVQMLSSSFEFPKRVVVNNQYLFRHSERDDLLVSFMKLIKIASHNNAAMVLIRHGYVQEAYALCRMIDEAYGDIQFMATPLGDDGQPSALQLQFLKEFFQDEFAGEDLVESQIPRHRVPRQKIRAAITRVWLDGDKRDISRELKVGRALYGTFSGFVHGAYAHLMELFVGQPPRFHTQGMIGTPRIQESLANQVNYVYRSLLAVEGVGHRAFREDAVYRALDVNIALARQTKCVKQDGIEMLERRRLRPLVQPT